jgi:sugar/nucleoside kinase (ribokinase family)
MIPAVFDLVTAGTSFDDLVFYGLARLPDAGQELTTQAFCRSPGGGAIITAVAASRLDLRCAVVSALSAESVRLLRHEGITARNLRRAGEPTAITVALSTRTDRRFVTFDGVNHRLPDRIRAFLPLTRARHVHFAFCPQDCRPWIPSIEALRRRGTTTSWDFGWDRELPKDPRFFELATAVDYLFVNRDEALLYARRDDLRAALDRWRGSPHHVVVKLGAAGSRVVGNGDELRAAARRARVVDTTGAGDAFNAGFLVARLRGASLGRALALGNRLGAQSIGHAGGIAGLPPAAASR